jgi:hypothetical protein
MILQLLHSEFPHIYGKFSFLSVCPPLFLSLSSPAATINLFYSPIFLLIIEGSILNRQHSAFYTLAHAFYTRTCKTYMTIYLHKRAHMFGAPILCVLL